MPENGLISFDVKAQKTTGVMSFTAQADGAKSNPALVKVHAAAPQSYTVKVRQSQDLGHVDLRSDLITDGFRNPISTLSFVTGRTNSCEGAVSHFIYCALIRTHGRA